MHQIIDDQGIRRNCGCLPRLTAPGDFLPVLGEPETAPLIPRAQWHDVDNSAHTYFTLDQRNQNSCTTVAAAGAIQHAREVMQGLRIPLAWSATYGAINGGRDAGASLDACITHLMRIGIPPAEIEGAKYIDPFDWQGYHRGTYPQDWKLRAAEITAIEAWDCPSVDHVVAALHAATTPVVGIFWTPRSGHAIRLVGWDNVRRRARLHNSWGRSWGSNGFGWVDQATLARGIQVFGAFAVRVVSRHPADPQPPAPVA